MVFTSNHQTNSFSFPSSSSSSSPHWYHDVFLSFRGTDTRKTFTGHLYTALKQAGIRPFMDDEELSTGKEIKQELKKAICESKMYIIVFSENYASSRWCLDELVEIIECKNTMGRLVIPLFYHVDPAVVRHQSGSYAKAFQHFVAVLEKRKVGKPPTNLLTQWLSWVGRMWKNDSFAPELELKKMEKWRTALTEAANLSGHDLRTEENGNESRFIQKIVSKVLPQVIPGCLILPDNPVGIGCRVKNINQLLIIESNEVRTIGIHGMGGIGKTTISKAVFNENLHRFESASFVENIKDTSKLPDGLLRLQEKLLFQLMKRPDVKVSSVDHGIEFINRICQSKRVLILLDDLDDLIQVKSLAPFAGQRCFSSGSRVIITTRDVQLLKQVQVDADYEVVELDENESLELFSWHAFRRAFPPEDYQLISKGIVRYAQGLPLVLEVIGSYLVQKTTKEWESTLKRLHQIPDKKIQDILQISFDALGEDKAKDIFLDLACFFIGMDKYFATNIWDACGYFPEDGISNLKSKSLLKIDGANCLRMHEQLRDMGREIIRKESPKWPEMRSRLWHHEEVIDVLTNHKGTRAIEGISLDLSRLGPIHLDASTFGAMHILRLLQINNVHLTGCFENIFKELRWLSWHYCPLECLPSEFCPGKLVMLDMKYSKFNELWQGVKHLKNLKILDLSFCKFLVKTPNFVGTKSLERLMLRGCENLIEVHPSIGLLRRLHYLDLRECKNLKNIPNNLCDLGSLEDLLLYECSNLEKLPEQIGNIKCLRSLDASYNVNITELPDSIGLLRGLVQLNLGNCENLKTLPNSICNLSSLLRLNMSGCSNLEQLPEQLGNIECLLFLDLSDCKKLIHLPTSICNLRLLKDLHISRLSNLERLPDELGNMNSLRRLFANGTAIKELPDSIGLLSKLVDLSLEFCVKLEVLPSSICDLRSLEELNLNFCSNLTQLPEQLGNMKVLRTLFTNGTAFKWLPDSMQLLKNLKALALDGCMNSNAPLSFFKRYVLPFKSTLQWLELQNCSLCDEDIPDDIGLYLSSLTRLNLSGNKFCTLPSSLGQLSNLLKLTLSNCTSLVSLPELPPNLYEFDSSGCTSLEKLPNLSNLKYLFQLDLTDCSRLVEVQGLENLNSLEYVHMAGCNNLEISTLKNFFQRYFEHADEIILPRWEIPQWFTDQRMESSISFNMPPTPTNNFEGIILWVVYVKSDIYFDHPNYYSAVIKNKTTGITWVHGKDVFKHTSRVEGHSWVTCIQGNLSSKDTIEIFINQLENGAKVERCGIHFLYEPDVNGVNIYDRKRGRDDLQLSNDESAKRWCLDELVEIIECKNTMRRLVIPLFYHVDLCVVRHQSGSYAEAFQHFVAVLEERKLEAESELKRMEKWRAALTEAANLRGHDLRTEENGNEARFIAKIVGKVQHEVNLNVPESPVIVDSNFNCINTLLSIGSEDVRTIGICGMGGIGKTTVSKGLYHKYSNHFEGSAFVEDIKDVSKQPGGLLGLQQKLLSQLEKKEKSEPRNSDDGISLIKKICCSRKVLILLDDLDDFDQIKKLVGQERRFSAGSRVIIVTRDVKLLKEAKVDDAYEMKGLNDDESLELFRLHAFGEGKPFPSEDYKSLSIETTKYCQGLPLALEVIGCHIRCMDGLTSSSWKIVLEEFRKYPAKKILDRLKISYDALSEHGKKIFLDVACIFIGWDKDYLVKFWDGCGFSPENSIRELSGKCLLKVDEENCLRMHDHLRDMGRTIVLEASDPSLQKHSRVWIHEEAEHLLEHPKGAKAVECLSNLPSIALETKACEAMHQLRFLLIEDVRVDITGSFKKLFGKLRWLRWQCCHLKSLPTDFHPRELVVLQLQHSLIEKLWEGVKRLDKLKILDLSYSGLVETPNFTGVPSLERLMLKSCQRLSTIDPSICRLRSLEELDLEGCSMLERLPEGLGNMKSLKTLNVGGTLLEGLPDSIGQLSRLVHLRLERCEELKTLPTTIGNLISLEELDVSFSKYLNRLPEELGNLKRLVDLDLSYCKKLTNLPASTCNRTSLEKLNVKCCSNLERLPEGMGNLKSLRTLNASVTGLEELPDSIGDLSSLVDLDLGQCSNLKRLPEEMGNLKSLRTLDAFSTGLEELPDSTGHLSSLVHLNLNSCSNLKRLPEGMGNLKSLRTLTAIDAGLEELPDSIGHLSSLVDLNLSYCDKLKTLPDSICDLSSLEVLNIYRCRHLQQLPYRLGNMVSLRNLNAIDIGCQQMSTVILENLKKLESLSLRLPYRGPQFRAFERFVLPFKSSLKTLELVNCGLDDEDIQEICILSLQFLDLRGNNFCYLPSGLCQLSNLTKLFLSKCSCLVSLPELPPNLSMLFARRCTAMKNIPNLSNLKRLRYLDLSDSNRLVEVQGLENLKLRSLNMAGCNDLAMNTTFNERFFQGYLGRVSDESNILLPKWRDFQNWIIYQSMESTISFELPRSLPDNFQGIILWVVYAQFSSGNYYEADITNITSGREWKLFQRSKHYINCLGGHSWVSCIKSYFRSGDSIKISISEDINVKVEKCGVHWLIGSEGDEDENVHDGDDYDGGDYYDYDDDGDGDGDGEEETVHDGDDYDGGDDYDYDSDGDGDDYDYEEETERDVSLKRGH